MAKGKIFKNSILLLILVFSFVLYFSIPSEIILPEYSHASIRTFPMSFFQETGAATQSKPLIKQNQSSLDITSAGTGSFKYNVKIFNSLPFKNVNVSVIPKNYVIPSGETVGVKMFTQGLLVIYVTSFIDINGAESAPARDSGIRENDRILTVDGIDIANSEKFSDYINNSDDTVQLTIDRGGEILTLDVTPALADDNKYKIGLWVRDSTAGIGTMTFYKPDSGLFAALGHAICDADTGAVLKVANGSLLDCEIISVQKGEYGIPGELTGSFVGGVRGSIFENNEFGIYGCLYDIPQSNGNEIVVATRFQIKEGPAQILCDIDGEGVRRYDVQICGVSKEPVTDNKGIIIEVTDDELLKKTGGIVQGMSGSPIIQNNMLVGAVTHVLVNNPKRGYGIFAESMLEMLN